MGKSAFVEPNDTTRIELHGDVWIEVKNELTHAETQRLASSSITGMSRDQLSEAGDLNEIKVDFARHKLMRIQLYVIDWSLCDSKGKQVPVTSASIAALRPVVAALIDEALDAHIAEQEKKEAATAGATGLKAVSPSAD